jgi:small-conductance mechanosensitive channel
MHVALFNPTDEYSASAGGSARASSAFPVKVDAMEVNEMLDFPWLDIVYFGNSLRLWLVAAVVATAAFFVLEVAKAVLTRRLAKRAAKSDTQVDDTAVEILRAIRVSTLLVVSLYLGFRILVLPPQASSAFGFLLTLALAYQAAALANVAIDRWLAVRFAQPGLPRTAGAGFGAVRFVARAVAWGAIVLVALDNLGIEITTLVAGLGVGGVAVALAVQSILGDVFCSLSILLDKPFEIGDFIVVGDLAGTVENIGVKTTRVRSLGGEQLVFSNSDLVGSRVRNYKRMRERRILFEFGVTYQTPPEKLAQIPATVRRIIEGLDDTRFDRANFKGFGDSALLFEVVYFVLVPDYNQYMDMQEAINLALVRAFAKDDIEFAYPTQTLYVQQVAGGQVAA